MKNLTEDFNPKKGIQEKLKGYKKCTKFSPFD
jgi:hypothetical protein